MTATMTTVWDRAAAFLGDNAAAIAPLALGALFVPMALSGSLRALLGTLGGAGDVVLGVALVLLSLATVWGNLAVTALALAPARSREPAVAAANARLLPVVGVYAALLAGLLVLMLPFGVALGMSGVDMAALSVGQTSAVTPNIGAATFVLLYLPVFAVLLLWLSGRLALIVPVVVTERRGLGALARSFALTRPVQWRIVGVLILYLVVSFVATAAARTVFGSVFGLLLGGDGPVTTASVLTATIMAGVSTALSLLSIAFGAELYLALRATGVDGTVSPV